jgi:trans-aconitate methyltransferase
MSRWSDFYKDRLNEGYENYVRNRYAPFIQEIISHPYHFIEEHGCGPGFITKIIRQDYPKDDVLYYMYDNDTDILELTKQNLEWNKHSRDILIQQHDLKKYSQMLPRYVDVIFSHGVLEHFDDNTIREVINMQLTRGKTLIHYVPSNKYEIPSFGDERLMSPKEWKNICQPTEIKEFNNGFDLILIWNQK